MGVKCRGEAPAESLPEPGNPGYWSSLGGCLAILLWSATFGIARSLSEAVGGMRAGAAVYLVGGLFSLVWLWPRGRAVGVRLPSWRYLGLCGFLFVFYTAVIYLAVGLARDRAQLLEVALLNYLWPILTILFSIPLLGTRARPALIPATALALAGLVLVMTHTESPSWEMLRARLAANPAAYALGLSGAVAWALYSNLARRWAEPGRGGAVELFIPATGLVLLAMSAAAGDGPARWSVRALIEALVMGGITFAAYALWDRAMQRGRLLLVVAVSYFTPLLSSLVSSLYLGVVPGMRLWAGCLLLVAGSVLSWWSTRPAERG